MSLNPFLHPRNPYRVKPDFKALAVKDSDFRAVVKQELSGKLTLDFKDREAVRVLTRTLLKLDFGLDVNMPPGSLVPTLPLRLNYLLWLEDLMDANDIKDVIGLDIGVGASGIYPLLAAKHLNWKMLGTEANEDNFKMAQKNVDSNNLNDKIKLALTTSSEHEQSQLFEPIEGMQEKISFTMCNPPFYGEDHDEESDPASDTPAGQDHELKTKGGEVEFISKMISDSKCVADKIPIFTCMVGHKCSLKALKKLCHEAEAKDKDFRFSDTEFCQGKTMRWALVWTFNSSTKLDTGPSLLKKKQTERKLHTPVTFTLTEMGPGCPISDGVSFMGQLTSWLEAIDVIVKPGKVENERITFTVKSFQQNWKNQRRRRREQERAAVAEPSSKKLKSSENDESEQKAKGDLQLSAKFSATLKDSSAHFEIVFIDGEAGKDGLYQLIQFLKNKAKGL